MGSPMWVLIASSRNYKTEGDAGDRGETAASWKRLAGLPWKEGVTTSLELGGLGSSDFPVQDQS